MGAKSSDFPKRQRKFKIFAIFFAKGLAGIIKVATFALANKKQR